MAIKLVLVFFPLMIALGDSSCEDSISCKGICSGNHINLVKIIKPGTRVNATALDKNEYSFLFNLCGGADCGDLNQQLTTAAVCQWKLDGSRGFSLGGPSDVTWTSNSATSFNVTYSGNTPGDGTIRSAVLMFVHGDNKVPTINFNQEVDSGIHTVYFTITAKKFTTGGNIDGLVYGPLAITILPLTACILAIVLLVYQLRLRRRNVIHNYGGHNYNRINNAPPPPYNEATRLITT